MQWQESVTVKPASPDRARPRVLLVSQKGDWAGLLRVPLLLRQAGASLDLLTREHALVRRSWHFNESFTCPDEPQALAAALKSHLEAHPYEWVILGDEPTLCAVADAAAADPDGGAWADGWFPIPDRANGMERILSKKAFAEVAPAYGVPVPTSITCGSVEEAWAAARQIGYPLMLKTALGCAGNGVLKCDNRDQLRDGIERFRYRLPLVVQRFVTGRLGSTQMLFDRGRPACWVPLYKAVCFPEPLGPSCVREMLTQEAIDAMAPIVAAVGEMTQFHGLCGMDWIEVSPDQFVILEFNPRPTPAMHMSPLAGVDCAGAMYRMLTGEAPAPVRPRPADAAHNRIYMFPQHLKRCLRNHEFGQLVHWLPGCGPKDIPWREPLLLASGVSSLMRISGRMTVNAAKRLVGLRPPRRRPQETPVAAA